MDGNKENKKAVQLARIGTPSSREKTQRFEGFEKFKTDSEGFINELNSVLSKYSQKFNGDKPMEAAIQKIRNSVETMKSFAKKRRNNMYATKLEVYGMRHNWR